MNNHTEFSSIEIIDVRKSYYIEQIKVPLIEVDHHETN